MNGPQNLVDQGMDIPNSSTTTESGGKLLGFFRTRALLLRRVPKKYKAARERLRVTAKHLRVTALLRVLKARYLVALSVRYLRRTTSKCLGAIVGLAAALIFGLTVPASLLQSASYSAVEIHLACAGIIGTALALILSLSIIPAQKAADVFSAAILQLYAKDRTTLIVFALLVVTTIISLLFWN